MQNAHLRMGKLTFVRQARDTITNITLGLNCLVAEPDSQTATSLHLVSVFGGDQDVGAVLAAIALERGLGYCFLSLNDPLGLHRVRVADDEFSVSGFSRAKLRFVLAALRSVRRRPALVVAAHVHLAPVAWAMKMRAPRLRVVVLTHGIGVWEPLFAASALGIASRRASAGAERRHGSSAGDQAGRLPGEDLPDGVGARSAVQRAARRLGEQTLACGVSCGPSGPHRRPLGGERTLQGRGHVDRRRPTPTARRTRSLPGGRGRGR